jgi:hypothetical protein
MMLQRAAAARKRRNGFDRTALFPGTLHWTDSASATSPPVLLRAASTRKRGREIFLLQTTPPTRASIGTTHIIWGEAVEFLVSTRERQGTSIDPPTERWKSGPDLCWYQLKKIQDLGLLPASVNQ